MRASAGGGNDAKGNGGLIQAPTTGEDRDLMRGELLAKGGRQAGQKGGATAGLKVIFNPAVQS